MVRLLRMSVDYSFVEDLRFNPTMVRLLLSPDPAVVVGDEEFQSHNGAIAAPALLSDDDDDYCFNPTMVRLLPVCKRATVGGGAGFNPTMVRLLPPKPVREFLKSYLFQSHNGAIAASPLYYAPARHHEFQSHNGAIAAGKAAKTMLCMF